MRYLLVDRILEWQPSRSIKGVKNVAMSEDFLEFHFPNMPVMPGLLLLEALVQLAGWLEAVSSDFSHWLLLQNVERCMFYGLTLPGDEVRLELQRSSTASPELSHYEGFCSVAGKRRIITEFNGGVVPLDHFENVEEQKRLFGILTRKEPFP